MNFPKMPKRGGARLAPKEKPVKKKPADMSPEELVALKKRRKKRLILILAVLLAVILGACAIYSTYVRPPDHGDDPIHIGPRPVVTDPNDPDYVDLGEAPEEVAVGRKPGVYTFIVCGQDTGGGGLTDTNMLVSYDTGANKLSIMSIPRDTAVNASWDVKKFNSVYNISGMDGLKEHVSKLTGIYPDHHVFVDYNAVEELVDAIGGVTFDVPVRMYYNDPTQNLLINIQKGEQKLTGEQAVQVARYRATYADGDIGRIGVQQDLVMAIIKQTLKVENIMKITEFAQIFSDNVETDLTIGNIIWFGQRLLSIDAENISLVTLPANYNGAGYSYSSRGYISYCFPYGNEIVELINADFNPYTRDIVTRDLQLLYRNSNGSLGVTTGSLADSRAGQVPPSTAKKAEEEHDEPIVDDSLDTTTTPAGDSGKSTSGDTQSGTNPPTETNTPAETTSSPKSTGGDSLGIPVDTPPAEETPVATLPPMPSPAPAGGGDMGIPIN